MGGGVVVVREYDRRKDRRRVEEVERRCEVGATGKLSLFTDLLGDPISRVRHSSPYLMLVAEMVVDGKKAAGEEEEEEEEEEREIVGIIRGCIKNVTCGQKRQLPPQNCKNGVFYPSKPLPIFTKLAYILGLRVSPSHRRMGIGMKLVSGMEEWFRDNGAEYSYMATESDNTASIELFTHNCGYSKFRTPSILVQPVFSHRVGLSRRISIFKLTPAEAECLYRRHFSNVELFPGDIDAVLTNKLHLGTYVAVPRGTYSTRSWPDAVQFLVSPPESWAVLSVWNCKDVFRLEVRGASRVIKGLAKTSRLLDRAFPWLRLPSVPDFFRPFGLHFLYGLGGEGPLGVKLIKALCGHAHNLAKESECAAVAAEVSSSDPLMLGIPHWKSLSCADLWCMKRLGDNYSDGVVSDWSKSPPGLSIFVDPREF